MAVSPYGALLPTTAAQGSGGVAWTNVSNILLEDGNVATSGVIGPGGGGGVPNQLNATGFGFNLPPTAIIDGIKLEVKAGAGQGTNDNGFIYLLYNGGNTAPLSSPNTGQNWFGSLAWFTYGGSTSLWGRAWTPSDINNANFGASFAAMPNTGTGTVTVDAARITVWWHTAPANVPKRYIYKVFNAAGIYIGNLPNVTSEFTFSQDINTGGTSINIECGISPDTSSLAADIYTDESGAPYTDEAGANNYTTEGVIPQVALGNAGYDALIKNGNGLIVYEYSYFYPNGIAMFSGELENWNGGFGGDNGHDSVQLVAYSDGSDLDNYTARAAPFSYTTDNSQTSQNASETIQQYRGTFLRSGQTFKTGSGVTNVGAITLLLNGSANVTVNLYDTPTKNNLLGTTSQVVSLSSPTSIQFAFPSIVFVSPLSIYFFEVAVDDGQTIIIYFQNTDVYANGQHYTASYGGGSGGGFGAATGDLYFVTASGSGSTSGTYTSKDPTTGMLLPAMTDYNLRGGLITCSASTVDATGLSLSYGLNTNTMLELIGGVYSMSPNPFYWYVDLGANLLYFKKASTTADFTLTKGLEINDLNVIASIENVKNSGLFSGATVAGNNVYTAYQDNTSIANYRVKLDRESDNRVSDLGTAQTIIKGNVIKQKDEQQMTQVAIIGTKSLDITLLRPGKTIGFNGYGTFVDSLVLMIVRWEYHPDYVKLVLGNLPKRMTPRYEQIVRGLVAQQTVANPSVPS